MFAKTHISNATVIMRDPLVLPFEQSEHPQQIYQKFLKLLLPIREEILKLYVCKNLRRCIRTALLLLLLREDPEEIFLKVMHLQDVLDSNSIGLTPNNPKLPGGLFLTASRLNHLCVPNADNLYDNISSCMVVIANRDIAIDEEITITYINHLNQRL